MRQQRGAKTHVSTDHQEKSFQKSTKERKKTKNLYTLNKQSDDQDSSLNHRLEQQENRKRRDSEYQQSGDQDLDEEQDDHMRLDKRSNVIVNRAKAALSDQSSSEIESLPQSSKQNLPRNYTAQSDNELLKLHMQVKQLQQQNLLLNSSLLSHQKRQKQMITKYAKFEADNKRLSYEITKLVKTQKQQMKKKQELKTVRRQIDEVRKVNQELLGVVESENVRIVMYLKGLVSRLVKEDSGKETVNGEKQSIAGYLEKCILVLKENRKTLSKNFPSISSSFQPKQSNKTSPISQTFPSAYQTQRIPKLLQQNSNLRNQLNKIKQTFQKVSQSYKKSTTQRQNEFKKQKKQLCQKYNNCIEEIKHKYKSLQIKIREQEQRYQLRISELQKTLAQKEKIIKKLKQQLQHMNVKLDEIQEERFSLARNSLPRKQSFKKSIKNYIDGDFLDQSQMSNKDRSYDRGYLSNKDQSFDRGSERNSKPRQHQESFIEYQQENGRRRKQPQESLGMMRKSHKVKTGSNVEVSVEREEKDIEKINLEIEELERQILEEFENQS